MCGGLPEGLQDRDEGEELQPHGQSVSEASGEELPGRIQSARISSTSAALSDFL